MTLYSVKMRGTKDHNHISGAENIIDESILEESVNLLLNRALNHSKGKSSSINIKIEEIENEEIEYIQPLSVTTVNTKNQEQSYIFIDEKLEELGISIKSREYIIEVFKDIKNMRGATIIDINTLQRIEKDKKRGIRATYMDFENNNLNILTKDFKYENKLLGSNGLRLNTYFMNALCLSSKVCNAPNIIGELCCSDDKNYTIGYIASKEFGYVRINNMKEVGEERGGRVFLYDGSMDKSFSLEDTINYLENKKIIVKNNIVFK